ncbi:peptidylprolyl isomerase [Agaricicola taiwanensis]|uniref:Parvulin-like PPIase n=1 Tax=Agaricicola taiwanensis TaxID=591372 RepID=A0A8J2YLL9_9RHOB|nr:peptidylprolyl isomerase [Agaricicola taiwanensis]GGE52760.1 peptidylprolyl isomerase [Agaricicola taiwanensis]
MRFIPRHLLALPLTACLIASPLAAVTALAQENKVVARVDGAEITEADVELAMKDFGQALGAMPEEQKREAVTRLLIDTKLIARAAEKDAVQESEDFKRTMGYLRDKALMDTYLTAKGDEAVTEDEIKKVYEETVKSTKPEQEVRARHILFRAEDEAGMAEAEKKAKDVAQKLKEGGDFEALAKELSEDPGSKENGGDLGYFTKETMVPEFAETAFKLDKGQVSDPIKTQFGWHVIKVEDKRDQPVPSIDQVRDQIVVYLQRKSQQDTIEGLRKDAKIERIGGPVAPEAPAEGGKPAAPAPAN